ncbi:hypothetical protein ACMSWQ_002347, partial [Cronobacter sakazakii]
VHHSTPWLMMKNRCLPEYNVLGLTDKVDICIIPSCAYKQRDMRPNQSESESMFWLGLQSLFGSQQPGM